MSLENTLESPTLSVSSAISPTTIKPRGWEFYLKELNIQTSDRIRLEFLVALTGLKVESTNRELVKKHQWDKLPVAALTQLERFYKIVTAIAPETQYHFQAYLIASMQYPSRYLPPMILHMVTEACKRDPATAARVLEIPWLKSQLPPDYIHIHIPRPSKAKAMLASGLAVLPLAIGLCIFALPWGMIVMLAVFKSIDTVPFFTLSLAVGYAIVTLAYALAYGWRNRHGTAANTDINGNTFFGVFFNIGKKIVFFPIALFLGTAQLIYLSYRVGYEQLFAKEGSYFSMLEKLLFRDFPLAVYFSATAFRQQIAPNVPYPLSEWTNIAQPVAVQSITADSSISAIGLPTACVTAPNEIHAPIRRGGTQGDSKYQGPQIRFSSNPVGGEEERHRLLTVPEEGVPEEIEMETRESAETTGTATIRKRHFEFDNNSCSI